MEGELASFVDCDSGNESSKRFRPFYENPISFAVLKLLYPRKRKRLCEL